MELVCFCVSCTNFGWEIVYGFFYPPSMGRDHSLLLMDSDRFGLVYATIVFGPREWKHAPLVARNLAPMILAGSVLTTTMHWALILSFADSSVAYFWAGFRCQVLLSWRLRGAASIPRKHSRSVHDHLVSDQSTTSSI